MYAVFSHETVRNDFTFRVRAAKLETSHSGPAPRQRVDVVVCLQVDAHLLEQGAEAALWALQVQQR